MGALDFIWLPSGRGGRRRPSPPDVGRRHPPPSCCRPGLADHGQRTIRGEPRLSPRWHGSCCLA